MEQKPGQEPQKITEQETDVPKLCPFYGEPCERHNDTCKFWTQSKQERPGILAGTTVVVEIGMCMVQAIVEQMNAIMYNQLNANKMLTALLHAHGLGARGN